VERCEPAAFDAPGRVQRILSRSGLVRFFLQELSGWTTAFRHGSNVTLVEGFGNVTDKGLCNRAYLGTNRSRASSKRLGYWMESRTGSLASLSGENDSLARSHSPSNRRSTIASELATTHQEREPTLALPRSPFLDR
jgi:hypothetical protein